jgi:hypothetical protein
MVRKRKSSDAPALQATSQSSSAAGHNARADIRSAIQRTAFEKLWNCDRDIKATVAQHVTPLREERSEIWKTLRNDLDAKAADLSPLYALYKRDRELSEIDDEDEAKKSQDMLREGFEALQQGETLNFLTVLGGAGPKREEPEHISTKTARAAGRQAGQAGKSATLNPHAEGSDLHATWNEGHFEGTAENLPGKAPAAAGDPFGPSETTAH